MSSQAGTGYQQPPQVQDGTVRERTQALGQELSGLAKLVEALEGQISSVTRGDVPDDPRLPRIVGSGADGPRRAPQCEVAVALDAANSAVRMIAARVNRLIDRIEV